MDCMCGGWVGVRKVRRSGMGAAGSLPDPGIGVRCMGTGKDLWLHGPDLHVADPSFRSSFSKLV